MFKGLAFFIIALLFCSCNRDITSQKRIVSGLTYSFKGLTFEESFVLGSDSSVLLKNEVPLNSKITIVMNGLSNFAVRDNKVFPGISVTVTIGNQTVMQTDDVLASSEGFTVTEASSLRGSVTLSPPVMVNQTYHVKMRVWDKQKIENEVSSEIELEVK